METKSHHVNQGVLTPKKDGILMNYEIIYLYLKPTIPSGLNHTNLIHDNQKPLQQFIFDGIILGSKPRVIITLLENYRFNVWEYMI